MAADDATGRPQHEPRARRESVHGARATPIAAVVLLVLTAALFTAMALPSASRGIVRLDAEYLALMIDVRVAPLTWLAMALDVVGSVWVMLPARIVVGGYLALRRRWRGLAVFALAVISSEVAIGLLKAYYARPRPLGSLVATSAASFPSGHSVAAAVTALAAVFALVGPESRRRSWVLLAAAIAGIMALSRAYLGAHWVSDTIGGALLGSLFAVAAATLVDPLTRRVAVPAGA